MEQQELGLQDVKNKLAGIQFEIRKAIIGMDETIESIFLCLFSGSGISSKAGGNCHILLEGVPGVAKTFLLSTLGRATGMGMKRISFSVDILPKDVIGIEDFNKKSKLVRLLVEGPVFANFLLADEINRARTPSRALLLEAMQEGNITTELKGTYRLPFPFMVMATQNPVEAEGTFMLGRAELDRFLMMVRVGYPSSADEVEIIKRYTGEASERIHIDPVVDEATVLEMRSAIMRHVHVDDSIYVLAQRIDQETRPEFSTLDSIRESISFMGGASPRAGMNFVRAGRVHAMLRGREHVTPEDLSAIALRILRHRLAFKTGVDDSEDRIVEIVGEVCDKVLSKKSVV